MLMIRLTRMGKKHQPTYRVVVTPKQNASQGDYLEKIGLYNPLREVVEIDMKKAVEWLDKGAMPSDRVARLLTKAGVKHKSIVVKHYTPKPEAEEKVEVKSAAETPVEDTIESTEDVTEEVVDTVEVDEVPVAEESIEQSASLTAEVETSAEEPTA